MNINKIQILKKLKEISMDQLENREVPEKEMIKVVKNKETFEGDEIEYYDTIYNDKELRRIERGKHPTGGINPAVPADAVE